MKPIKNLNIALICVMLLLFGGCQKCKKDPAPDPCLGYKPMSADFKMTQTLNPLSAEYPDWSKSLEVDTVLAGASVSFEANQDLDAYEWRVGNDNRTWNTKNFSLRFFALADEGIRMPVSINITLKGKRTRTEKDSICNKNPKYEEIIIKTLVVVPRYSRPALVGEYEGYASDNLTEKFVVRINHTPPRDLSSDDWNEYELYFDNLNNGCRVVKPAILWSRLAPAYTGGFFNGGNYSLKPCDVGVAIFWLNKTKDSLNIQYLRLKGTGATATTEKTFFKGKRIK